MKQGKVIDTHDNDRYIGQYSTTEQQIRADVMLSRKMYEVEWKQYQKQIKQVENRRSDEYNFYSIGKQTIPNETNFVRKDREDSLTYFGVPYRTEMQTPRLGEFTSERQAMRKESQSRKVNSLDSIHLEREAIKNISG